MSDHGISVFRGVKWGSLLAAVFFVISVSYAFADHQLMRVLFVCATSSLLLVCLYLRRLWQLLSKLIVSVDGIRADAENYFVQTESLLSLMATIRPNAPLPTTRVWAASPDFLCEVASRILRDKPRLIVEASSGASTVVIAYCLQMIGEGGRVISLEHDEYYASATSKQLKTHGLAEFSTVAYSPLTDCELNGKQVRWYEASAIPESARIDMLVVDGPPARDDFDAEARFPALPLLISRLPIGSTVILDDARRQGEKQTVQEWLRLFPNFDHEYLCLEKGASVLVKRG
jgi:predicted O-methyltransferase YrrM